MKKLKIAIMTSIILFSIVASYATTRGDCTQLEQYYKDGTSGNYYPAGTVGVNYICHLSASNCTYTSPSPGVYVLCTVGTYTPADLNRQPSQDKSAKK